LVKVVNICAIFWSRFTAVNHPWRSQ